MKGHVLIVYDSDVSLGNSFMSALAFCQRNRAAANLAASFEGSAMQNNLQMLRNRLGYENHATVALYIGLATDETVDGAFKIFADHPSRNVFFLGKSADIPLRLCHTGIKTLEALALIEVRHVLDRFAKFSDGGLLLVVEENPTPEFFAAAKTLLC